MEKCLIPGDIIGIISDKIDIILCKNIPIRFRFLNYYEKLNKYKNRIDSKSTEWDKMKKFSNPYELIHISNGRYRFNQSIAKYVPLSRSYFKMWEIIIEFDLFKNINEPIIAACLAEGPGGFMEAISNYRKTKMNISDRIYGITLEPNNKYIPGWDKLSNLKDGEKIENKFNITYGNLYNLADLKKFIEIFDKKNKKAFIITADGGFDYSTDFNNQETLSYRIIFCEMAAALSIQEKGGHFICKVFDIFTVFTIKVIQILNNLYEEVYLYKPKTSRRANSEKYIIAKVFKGEFEDDKNFLESMYQIIEKWDEKELYDISGIIVNEKLYQFLDKYNNYFMKNQLEYIKLTMEYMESKLSTEKYREIIENQSRNAVDWCHKYDIAINNQSKYIKN